MARVPRLRETFTGDVHVSSEIRVLILRASWMLSLFSLWEHRDFKGTSKRAQARQWIGKKSVTAIQSDWGNIRKVKSGKKERNRNAVQDVIHQLSPSWQEKRQQNSENDIQQGSLHKRNHLFSSTSTSQGFTVLTLLSWTSQGHLPLNTHLKVLVPLTMHVQNTIWFGWEVLFRHIYYILNLSSDLRVNPMLI